MGKKVVETKVTQKYTSANTSINRKRPAIYGMVSDKISDTDQVIDYGCGKYFDDYDLPSNYFGYDPFNRNDETVLNNKYDIALCSNVINVIMEKEVRTELLHILKNIANKVFITIYEGSGDGNGRVTMPDCYQVNMKKKDYFAEIAEVFGIDNVKYTHGYFECWSGEGVVV